MKKVSAVVFAERYIRWIILCLPLLFFSECKNPMEPLRRRNPNERHWDLPVSFLSTVSALLSPDLIFFCLLFVLCANPPNYFALSKVELQNVVVYHSIHKHFSYTDFS